MEYVPIGKRTRLQKYQIRKNSFGNSGFSSSNDDNGDDDECLIIDKTEFLKSICSNSDKKSAKLDVGIEKNTSNFGRVYDYHGVISKGLDNRVESIVNDEVVVEDDEEEEDDDDDDDDDDEEEEEEDEDENVYTLVDVDVGNDSVHVDGDGNGGVDIDGGKNNVGVRVEVHVDDNGNDEVHVDDADADADADADVSVEDWKADFHVDDGNDDVLVDDDVSTDDEDDDDDDNNDAEEDDDEEDEEEVPEVKLRKFEGMVLPTHIIDNDVGGSDFIAKRTRSHYKSSHILNHGTPKSPISIDIEEELSDHESNKPEYGEGRKKRGRPPLNKDDKVGLENLDSGEKKKRGRPPLNKDEQAELDSLDGGEKKKRGRPPLVKKTKEDLELMEPSSKRLKTKGIQDVLLNAILENGKNAGITKIASSVSQSFLPLKFGCEAKKVVPEISEEEQEVNSLFKEMQFALGVCDIGFEPHSLDNNDDEDDTAVLCDSVILQQKQCLAGKHYWIYDELIGEKCCFCSIVKLEIKYVTPAFNKNPFGVTKDPTYYGKFPYNDTKDSDRYQFTDLCNNIQGDDDHSLPNDQFSGTVWDLIPGVARTLYPHQRDGFEFIWRNIAGGIRMDEIAKATGSGTGGCIICHAAGTGKTLLAIVFLQSFLKQYPKSRPVIIAPYSMIRTWEEEFDRWSVGIPFYNLNEKQLSGKENLQVLNGRKVKKSMKDEHSIRIAKLHTWSMGSGVLAVSYGLFQRLAGDGKGVDEKMRQAILEQPDILVLDEGHTARNEKSSIVKVLSKVVTKRRVILSGTPFQNNFEELHTTIALVREEFGVLSCCNMNNDQKIAKLRKQIAPFVHVHKGEILRDTLPGLFRSLIVLRPSDLQKNIFAHMARIRFPFLQFDNWISLASVHPSIFCEIDSGFPLDKEQEALMKVHRTDLDAGPKIRFVVELIKLCKGERVLVFGQRLPCLSFIGDLLESMFDWTMGRDFLYIDGSQNMKDRQSLIKFFNDPGSEAKVLLASTKACSEGISLVGASRVVLLDVVWNPSVESQAISRAYRIGQKKDVFVYHLITSGTLEEDKFRRQVTKEHYSKLLFSSSTASEKETLVNKKSLGSKMVAEDRVLEEMTHHEKTKYMFERIVSQPKAGDDMIKSFD